MTQDEEMALRELAAKPHYLPQVAAALGPMSLWSRTALEAEIRKAVEAEREACAKLAEEYGTWGGSSFYEWFKKLGAEIRARGEKA
jgi:hypothetical protein